MNLISEVTWHMRYESHMKRGIVVLGAERCICLFCFHFLGGGNCNSLSFLAYLLHLKWVKPQPNLSGALGIESWENKIQALPSQIKVYIVSYLITDVKDRRTRQYFCVKHLPLDICGGPNGSQTALWGTQLGSSLARLHSGMITAHPMFKEACLYGLYN